MIATADRATEEARHEAMLRACNRTNILLAETYRDRDLQVKLWRYYQDHVAKWIDDWVLTYDPREDPANLPMQLWPKQREFIRWLEAVVDRGGDAVVEKSRDFGASWLCIAFAAHRWIFRRGFKANFASNKADKVDRLGDYDSLFEKLRHLLRELPPWQLPPRTKRIEKYMTFLNETNGSGITGESGRDIGRGGRCTVLFLDEAAFLEHADSANAASAATARCRIWLSTPNGQGNQFAIKRFALPEDRVFVMDWHDDPRKSEAWARQKREEIGTVAWAREFDRDYAASVEGIIIRADWVQAAVELHRRGVIPPGGPVVCGLDVGGGGSGKTVHVVRRGPVIEMPVSWTGGDTTADACRAADLTRAAGTGVALFYDSIGVGMGVGSTLERISGVSSTGVNVGEPATHRGWPDGQRAREKFTNYKAEIWWTMRDRFLKAYEHRCFLDGEDGGVEHPQEELITLPPQARTLQMQLSQITAGYRETGKISVESKDSLKRRGIPSPDEADALALTFAEDRRGFSVRPVRGLY